MSRSSSEREYKDEQLLKELVARLQPVFTILSDAEADFVIANCNWYAEQKIKQMFDEENNRGDRYMSCSQCKKEFEWNGKDKGELIRVRGSGMWCRACLGGPYNV